MYRDWAPEDEGMVSIEITGLGRKVNKKRLAETLSDIYRVLLENGQVQIVLNGEKVKPLKIPVLKREKFREELPGGSEISGWLGIREGKAEGIKGGMRCYIFGRKIIDREYFSHPDPSYKASLNKLVGEIELNSVEPILNKTDLDRGSYEWEKAQEFVYRKMDPYVKALLGEEEPDLPSEKEIKNVREAQKIFEQYLKYTRDLDRQKVVEGRVSPTLGDDRGQKDPEPEQKQVPNPATEREERGPYQPATPPPLGAIGKRKRTGGFGTWRIEPFDEIMRSVIRPENESRVLVINNKFPLYKIRKRKDGKIDGWYIWETALMEYAKPEEGEEMTHQEYLEELGRITLDFDRFLKKQSRKG